MRSNIMVVIEATISRREIKNANNKSLINDECKCGCDIFEGCMDKE